MCTHSCRFNLYAYNKYNYSSCLQDVLCDVWWSPGTSDPDKPCYGYWNEKGKNTPVQFFGLSSVGATILEYFNFNPGKNPPGKLIVS